MSLAFRSKPGTIHNASSTTNGSKNIADNSTPAQPHNIFSLSPVEVRDDLDDRHEHCYILVQSQTKSNTNLTLQSLTNVASRDVKSHEDVCLGLLIHILVGANNISECEDHFRNLTLVARDGLSFACTHLTHIVLEKYPRLLPECRQQLLWLTRQMIQSSVNSMENICWNLMRQIAGGSVTASNLWLADQLMDIFQENRSWLEKFPFLLASVVYTYLRIIEDHFLIAALREKEVSFVISLMRSNFVDVSVIGRDLVRVLQNVSHIGAFQSLWSDILHRPNVLSPTFSGLSQLMQTRTSRRFLQSRITPEMERRLVFLTSQVRFGSHKRYQDWFQRQYLATPESQSLRCDLIRFIVGVIHPTNELLSSDIIPRWAVIGWLLTTCTTHLSSADAKLALFYDWLYFSVDRDNIMNIEPGILVIHHSMRSHPTISASLLDFLNRIMANFCPSEGAMVQKGIYSSLRTILEKRVLQNLVALFESPRLDNDLRAALRHSFAPFFGGGVGGGPSMGSADSGGPPVASNGFESSSVSYVGGTGENENSKVVSYGTTSSSGAKFSDDEDEDGEITLLERDDATTSKKSSSTNSVKNNKKSTKIGQKGKSSVSINSREGKENQDLMSQNNDSTPNTNSEEHNNVKKFNVEEFKIENHTNTPPPNTIEILQILQDDIKSDNTCINDDKILNEEKLEKERLIDIPDENELTTGKSNAESIPTKLIDICEYYFKDVETSTTTTTTSNIECLERLVGSISTSTANSSSSSNSPQLIISSMNMSKDCKSIASFLTTHLTSEFEGRLFHQHHHNLSLRFSERCIKSEKKRMRKIRKMSTSTKNEISSEKKHPWYPSIFILFKYIICDTNTSSSSNVSNATRKCLLKILAEIYSLQPRVGYYLLYYLTLTRATSVVNRSSKMASAYTSSSCRSGSLKDQQRRKTLTVYRDLCEAIDNKYALDICLVNDLRQCQDDDVDLFVHLIVEIFVAFPKQCIGNVDLLYLIVSSVDGCQMHKLASLIMSNKDFIIFRDVLSTSTSPSVHQLIETSLTWETFEQHVFWTLFTVHDISIECVVPFINRLSVTQHPEALTAILTLLKTEDPTPDIIKGVMTRPCCECNVHDVEDTFTVAILHYWVQQSDPDDILGDLISSYLSKQASSLSHHSHSSSAVSSSSLSLGSGLLTSPSDHHRHNKQRMTSTSESVSELTPSSVITTHFCPYVGLHPAESCLSHLDRLYRLSSSTKCGRDFFAQSNILASIDQVRQRCDRPQLRTYARFFNTVLTHVRVNVTDSDDEETTTAGGSDDTTEDEEDYFDKKSTKNKSKSSKVGRSTSTKSKNAGKGGKKSTTTNSASASSLSEAASSIESEDETIYDEISDNESSPHKLSKKLDSSRQKSRGVGGVGSRHKIIDSDDSDSLQISDIHSTSPGGPPPKKNNSRASPSVNNSKKRGSGTVTASSVGSGSRKRSRPTSSDNKQMSTDDENDEENDALDSNDMTSNEKRSKRRKASATKTVDPKRVHHKKLTATSSAEVSDISD